MIEGSFTDSIALYTVLHEAGKNMVSGVLEQ